ncbi:unnamed protein product [Brassicogethes aeneus]|uniref:Uncharacterized protein n=1 Tax=Brassicogethes aeneus TaxID=1431903 RepID=A0A9P0B727_BRAAE|nr:unnamed protein product [Brassicogethes aeneus]
MFGVLFIFGIFTQLVLAKSANFKSFPTRQEQVNLLTNVQEVFEEIKFLVSEESKMTVDSVKDDVEKVIRRGSEFLDIYVELVTNRVSAFSNSACSLEPKGKMREIAKEGKELIKGCALRSNEDIVESTTQTGNTTNVALKKGQELLDSLGDCSRKPAFQLISCYKGIIDTDVVPVKLIFLRALKDHQKDHLRVIEVRNEANECVDTILDGYRVKMDAMLKKALEC